MARFRREGIKGEPIATPKSPIIRSASPKSIILPTYRYSNTPPKARKIKITITALVTISKVIVPLAKG